MGPAAGPFLYSTPLAKRLFDAGLDALNLTLSIQTILIPTPRPPDVCARSPADEFLVYRYLPHIPGGRRGNGRRRGGISAYLRPGSIAPPGHTKAPVPIRSTVGAGSTSSA